MGKKSKTVHVVDQLHDDLRKFACLSSTTIEDVADKALRIYLRNNKAK